MSTITVTGLCTYPIKSCRGVALSQATITPRGLGHDRDYMLVGDDGAFLSQRQIPELALVVPTLAERGITLNAPGMPAIDVPYWVEPDDRRRIEATVHGTPVAGQVLADELGDWFTAFLPADGVNRRYRLLRVRDDAPRSIAQRYRRTDASNAVGFADGYAILLATEPSLAQLNTEMDRPVGMDRFRPNIVVGGTALRAYDEDSWTEVQIGSLRAFIVKGCDRCSIPDVDQQTAFTGKAVRRALVSRRGANAHVPSDTGVFFAQNLAHVYTPGLTVSVGDAVEIIGRAAEPNVTLRIA